MEMQMAGMQMPVLKSAQCITAEQLQKDPATGLPVRSASFIDAGYDRQPDWTAGVTNTLRWKRWQLSFLVDLRKGSPTHGLRNTMYVGALRPWQILIPPGVAHGYKIIGTEPSMLIYMTDKFYNPADEGRIPHNVAGLNYDWELQYK